MTNPKTGASLLSGFFASVVAHVHCAMGRLGCKRSPRAWLPPIGGLRLTPSFFWLAGGWWLVGRRYRFCAAAANCGARTLQVRGRGPCKTGSASREQRGSRAANCRRRTPLHTPASSPRDGGDGAAANPPSATLYAASAVWGLQLSAPAGCPAGLGGPGALAQEPSPAAGIALRPHVPARAACRRFSRSRRSSVRRCQFSVSVCRRSSLPLPALPRSTFWRQGAGEATLLGQCQ